MSNTNMGDNNNTNNNDNAGDATEVLTQEQRLAIIRGAPSGRVAQVGALWIITPDMVRVAHSHGHPQFMVARPDPTTGGSSSSVNVASYLQATGVYGQIDSGTADAVRRFLQVAREITRPRPDDMVIITYRLIPRRVIQELRSDN